MFTLFLKYWKICLATLYSVIIIWDYLLVPAQQMANYKARFISCKKQIAKIIMDWQFRISCWKVSLAEQRFDFLRTDKCIQISRCITSTNFVLQWNFFDSVLMMPNSVTRLGVFLQVSVTIFLTNKAQMLRNFFWLVGQNVTFD